MVLGFTCIIDERIRMHKEDASKKVKKIGRKKYPKVHYLGTFGYTSILNSESR